MYTTGKGGHRFKPGPGEWLSIFLKTAMRNYVYQFSLIDTRPLHGMAHVCQKHGIKLLTYGTLVRATSKILPIRERTPYDCSGQRF